MKYKKREIDDVFVMEFIGMTHDEQQKIMEEMNTDQLQVLSDLVVEATKALIQEKFVPMELGKVIGKSKVIGKN